MNKTNKFKRNPNIMEVMESIETFDEYQKIRSDKSPRIHTEVIAYNELGEELWRDHNELLLPGGLFTLSKISGVTPPIETQSVNVDLNVATTETETGYTGPRREDVICGFVIGIGGCTDVFDTVAEVKYKERTVTSIIPFRKVQKSDDLSQEEQEKYHLKQEDGEYYNYFLKGFETDPVIKVEYDEPGSPAVPANADEAVDDKVINSYLQYTLKINADDVREFFKISGGGLRKARVNTLAMVHGYPDGTGEYRGCRCFYKINFNNEPFDNETKELTVVYKIYI